MCSKSSHNSQELKSWQLETKRKTQKSRLPYQGVERRMVLVVNLIEFWKSFFFFFFCFVVAICDLVYDVEAIHGLC